MEKINRRFSINSIRIVNKTKVEYEYEYAPSLNKYFKKNEIFFIEFDIDVSNVPRSILGIPFLSNLLPISWFLGFDIYIDEVDENFFKAQEKIKNEFLRLYPELAKKPSGLMVDRLSKNSISGSKPAMLFSGGIDSYTTYFRHFDETPDLITVIGADIPLNDFTLQERVLSLNSSEKILEQNKKFVIKTNFQDFYTYHVDLLLPDLSWWGEVQHGMALIGSTSPLTYINGNNIVYIASTNTEKIQIPWGSNPYIDNNMKWADVEVIHDGYELERIDKIKYIVQESIARNYRPKLRVCYSKLNSKINCSECEKCVRSAFGIMLSNDNPNLYGFDFSEKIFDTIVHILSGKLNAKWKRRQWQQLTDLFRKHLNNIYLFGKDNNEPEIKLLLKIIIPDAFESNKQSSIIKKFKFVLLRKFPKEFDVYLKLREKIL